MKKESLKRYQVAYVATVKIRYTHDVVAHDKNEAIKIVKEGKVEHSDHETFSEHPIQSTFKAVEI